MKKSPRTVGHFSFSPLPKKLATILLIASAATAQASIIANESFDYSNGTLVGQASTGTGFAGNWTLATGFANNSTTAFSVTSGSLTMNGVYSAAGKVSYSRLADQTTAITQSFSTSLSATDTLYGSYLFSITADTGTQGRTVASIMVNSPGETDNTGTFVWAGNGYNSSTTVEGPNVRVEGTGTPVPTFSLTIGTTYVMLFELNATAKTTSAWVLNESQLTNFYASLNATALNAATGNTESATGVVWKGSVTSAGTLGSMTNLTLLGLSSTQLGAYGFDMDEIRFSDTSLLEAVAVPEPSTVAIALGLGAFALSRALRRRREA